MERSRRGPRNSKLRVSSPRFDGRIRIEAYRKVADVLRGEQGAIATVRRGGKPGGRRIIIVSREKGPSGGTECIRYSYVEDDIIAH